MKRTQRNCWFVPMSTAVTTVILTQTVMAGPYLFLEDFTGSARRLSEDMQKGNLDLSNSTDQAVQNFKLATNGTMRFRIVSERGLLLSVCPTLEIDFPNGRYFAYRTHHQNGSLEWIIRVSLKPEQIESALVVPSRDTGVPFILPPYQPSQGQSIEPPVGLGCSRAQHLRAGSAEEEKACARWPRMCASR